MRLWLADGEEVPVRAGAELTSGGTVAVMVICALSVANWNRVSGFADNPDSG